MTGRWLDAGLGAQSASDGRAVPSELESNSWTQFQYVYEAQESIARRLDRGGVLGLPPITLFTDGAFVLLYSRCSHVSGLANCKVWLKPFELNLLAPWTFMRSLGPWMVREDGGYKK